MKVKEFFRAVEEAYNESALIFSQFSTDDKELLKKADELKKIGREKQILFNRFLLRFIITVILCSFLGSFLGELVGKLF